MDDVDRKDNHHVHTTPEDVISGWLNVTPHTWRKRLQLCCCVNRNSILSSLCAQPLSLLPTAVTVQVVDPYTVSYWCTSSVSYRVVCTLPRAPSSCAQPLILMPTGIRKPTSRVTQAQARPRAQPFLFARHLSSFRKKSGPQYRPLWNH